MQTTKIIDEDSRPNTRLSNKFQLQTRSDTRMSFLHSKQYVLQGVLCHHDKQVFFCWTWNMFLLSLDAKLMPDWTSTSSFLMLSMLFIPCCGKRSRWWDWLSFSDLLLSWYWSCETSFPLSWVKDKRTRRILGILSWFCQGFSCFNPLSLFGCFSLLFVVVSLVLSSVVYHSLYWQ